MKRCNQMPFDAKLLDKLIDLMWESSEAILRIYDSGDFDTKLKSDQSPVTQADLAAHKILIKGLSQLTPNIPVVSEEDPDSLQIPSTYQKYWLLDPLDGTKEFLNRDVEFTCNLALIELHRTIFGLVTLPVMGLLYFGGKDLGSYRLNHSGDKTQLHCRRSPHICRVVTSKSHLNAETETFIHSLELPVELVQVGSSLKFIRIAEGLADLYPRIAPTREWDTAAAQAVLEGAGGSVAQLDGSPLIYGKTEILNPNFVAQTS